MNGPMYCRISGPKIRQARSIPANKSIKIIFVSFVMIGINTTSL